MIEDASGQVFTETVIPLHRSKSRRPRSNKDSVAVSLPSRRWLYNCRGSRLTDGCSDRGPPSLKLLAARALSRNLDLVENVALRGLPPHLLQTVWAWIKRSQLDNIRAWQLFAPLSETEPATTRHVTIPPSHLSGCTVPNGLQACLRGLESSTFDWLTTLRLVDVEHVLTQVDLNHLGTLQNLVGLHLVSPARASTTLDDRLIKAWGHQAGDDGAFPNLRSLFLTGHLNLTNLCFFSLESFPSLSLFGLQRWYHSAVPANPSLTWTEVTAMQLLHHLSICRGPGFSPIESATLVNDPCPNVEEVIMPCFKLLSDQLKEPKLRLNCSITTQLVLGVKDFEVDKPRCFERKRDFEVSMRSGPPITRRPRTTQSSSNIQPSRKREIKSSKRRRIEDVLF